MTVSFGTDETDAALATNWKHFRHRSIKNLALEFCTVFGRRENLTPTSLKTSRSRTKKQMNPQIYGVNATNITLTTLLSSMFCDQ